MVYKVIEDKKNVRAIDAACNAQARQEAPGYDQNSTSLFLKLHLQLLHHFHLLLISLS
jgi:hypothetical protein